MRRKGKREETRNRGGVGRRVERGNGHEGRGRNGVKDKGRKRRREEEIYKRKKER